jgi:hypothetical protein
MKKRWVILLALGLLLAIAVAFQLGRSQREPEFEGKSLSQWATVWVNSPGDSQRALEVAIHHMGTNALPCLVEWLDDGPLPPWKTRALKVMAKFPKRFGGNYALNELVVRAREKVFRFYFASEAFRILGDEALPATPDLLMMAMKPGSRRRGANAAGILIQFGPALHPQLITILRCPNASGRRPVIDHFRQIGATAVGTNASPVVEGLVLCLKDGDPMIRGEAILALGDLMLRPDFAVPALVKTCADADPAIRAAALGALSHYGPAARPARAAIIAALHDPDAEVRAVADMALQKIPE